MREWLASVRSELAKVAWPNGEEVSTYLRVVLIVVGTVLLLVVVLGALLDWI